MEKVVKLLIEWWCKRKIVWIYGTCHDRPARKHKIYGNVQFVLWKAGEQGHKEDYWHNFDSSWWNSFTPSA
jgi:hypothetical protein